jgi:uncharacterized membrane protein YgcG
VAFRATVKGLSLHRWPVVLVWRLLVRVARLNFLERLAAAHHSPPMVVSQLILVPEFIKPGMVARELPTPLQWALQRLAAAVAVPHSQEPREGAGGSGGGGAGASNGSNSANGTANTGGGGGASGLESGSANAGFGGSGVVIVRYLTP